MGRILGSSVQGKKSDDGTVEGVRNPGGRPSPENQGRLVLTTPAFFFMCPIAYSLESACRYEALI